MSIPSIDSMFVNIQLAFLKWILMFLSSLAFSHSPVCWMNVIEKSPNDEIEMILPSSVPPFLIETSNENVISS